MRRRGAGGHEIDENQVTAGRVAPGAAVVRRSIIGIAVRPRVETRMSTRTKRPRRRQKLSRAGRRPPEGVSREAARQLSEWKSEARRRAAEAPGGRFARQFPVQPLRQEDAGHAVAGPKPRDARPGGGHDAHAV